MPQSEQTLVDRLRTQAEHAMAGERAKATVTPLLERLVEVAPDGSPAALFAHRHLAEYRIEDHPWRALLHLRTLVRADRADDAVHALSGLAHALLGNYLAAVASYRRAVSIEPKNPWYRHNLGHLLDVALDRPRDALRHLEAASAASNGDPEITASLAHCLARLGHRAQAEELALRAARAAPASADHEELLGWIRAGAVAPEAPAATAHHAAAALVASAAVAAVAAKAPNAVDAAVESAADAVTEILLAAMPAGGFSPAQVDRALHLYATYRSGAAGGALGRAGARTPRVVAAALEYATARLEKVRGVTRASVARRYGVTPRAVSDRIGELEGALAMTLP